MRLMKNEVNSAKMLMRPFVDTSLDTWGNVGGTRPALVGAG
jgi:hypothetical protein